MSEKFKPVHPREILLGEFLKPMGLSQYRLAKDINVPARRIPVGSRGACVYGFPRWIGYIWTEKLKSISFQ
jgi:hypothetical protein